MKVKLNPLTS